MAGEEQDYTDTAADADFDSGFTPDLDTPTETPAVENEPESAEAPAPAPAVEESPAPKLAQVTEDQFRELFEKAQQVDQTRAELNKFRDTVFGSLGGLKQSIDRMQAQGGRVELSEEDFADLRAEYPELADVQFKVFNKILARQPGGAPVPEELETRVVQKFNDELGSRVDRTRGEIIDSHLDSVVDGDWKQVVASPEFGKWLDTAPPQIRALEASTSPRDAARLLRSFMKSQQIGRAHV